MEELCRYIPRIDNDDDDDGYDSPAATESWDDECNHYADFLARLDKESLVCLPRTDRRWIWEAVMGELIEAVKARNTRCEQRPTKLIDRRGRSLPRLNFD